MPDRVIKVPGPEHSITIEPHPGRIVIKVAGKTIADTISALVLREANYKPVHYIPREDANMGALTRSETASYCPYKGEASYFSIPAGGARSVDALWTYEVPYPDMRRIAGYLAFYEDRIDLAG